MKIVVLVKEVPDTYGDRKLDLETGLAVREASDPVVDEIGERALELALAAVDSGTEAEVLVLTVGPESAAASIRKMLAVGATSALHVVDESLRGADLGLTAEVIAAALRAEGFDLVIAGNQSTDGAAGLLPAMVAEHLDVPVVSNLESVEITADQVRGVRAGEDSQRRVSADLPAVISVTEQLPEARFPSFKGIMAAKKKALVVRSLDELGINASDMSVPRTIMTSIAERPPRAAGIKLVDDGAAAGRLAEFLSHNRLV